LPKELNIIVGGNGSGKSTFYYRFLAKRNLPFLTILYLLILSLAWLCYSLIAPCIARRHYPNGLNTVLERTIQKLSISRDLNYLEIAY
jgi:hypothetical protein